MTSTRRAARSQLAAPSAAAGIPVDLAAGPCIDLWADPAAPCARWSARRRWQEARDAWAARHDLTLPSDYHLLPRELCDRAAYTRQSNQKGGL